MTTNLNKGASMNSTENKLNIPINEWEVQAQGIRKNIDSIENQLCDLRNHMLELKYKTEASGEYTLTSIDDLSYGIEATNQLILKKNKESKLSLPLLKEKTSNTTESIGNIITHLQYHDIIRQKIEHIQDTHTKIIEDLGVQMNDSNKDEEISEAQIADIVGLQAAQLILVSKEYQNAIEIITSNFQQIANDIRDISTLSNNFSYDEQNSETTLIKRIIIKLDEAIILLDQSDTNRLRLEMEKSYSSFEKLNKRSFEKVISPLKNLIEKEDSIKDNKNNENSLNSQIISLIKEIDTQNINFEKKLNEIVKISNTLFIGDAENELGSEIEQEKIMLMVKISKILRSLDTDNSMLNTVLNQNDKLNGEILSKIEGTINKVEYYMLFEDVINEVIQKLNNINKTLKPKGGLSNDFSDLKEIEKLYTVKSERLVHNSITGQVDTEEEKEDEEDLELF